MKEIIVRIYLAYKESSKETIDIINNICFIFLYFIKYKKSYNFFIDDYLKKIKQDFNFEIKIISESEFNEINELFNLYYDEITTQIKDYGLINMLYTTFKEKIKIHLRFFEDYSSINDYINISSEFINDKKKYDSIINLCSGTGNFIDVLIKKNINIDNLCAYDIEEKINNICYINILLTNNINIKDKIIQSNILYDNKINNKYDLILCDITCNTKNIIHAKTCNIIKNLKIRGTKAEPLFLQLISQISNKNGDIIIICPTSLLFCDSNQHCETRKYIIDNFSINKVINLSDKKSILYITNINPEYSENLHFYDYCEQKNYYISYEKIKTCNYSLYFNNYNFDTIRETTNKIKLSKIIKIINSSDYIVNNQLCVLYSYKFNLLKIDIIDKTTKFDYVFCSLNEELYNNDFINYFLFYFLKENLNSITKGKMKQLCPELIYNLEISNIPAETQQLFISYYNHNHKIFEINNTQLYNLEKIKNLIISNYISTSEYYELCKICNILNKPTNSDNLYIYKNSNFVGKIFNNNNSYNENNVYYLSLINENINYNYLYIILQFYENEIIKLANMNSVVNLSKNKLELFKIPVLSIDLQIKLITDLSFIDNYINTISSVNNNILNFNFIKYHFIKI
jgi:hypothetical protein